MNKNQYFIIQLHAALTLVGYWCFHAIFSFIFGESNRSISVIYDGIQLALSLFVIRICKQDFRVTRKQPILYFYSLTLTLYAIRMVYDMMFGPFVGKVSTEMFLNDIMLIVCSMFMGGWAIVVSRRYINVDVVTRLVFFIGVVAITVIHLKIMMGASYLSKTDRMEVAQGLGALQLAKLGAIALISSIHLFMNSGKKKMLKIIYIVGFAMSGWVMLTSGSRGTFVGVVIALLLYVLFSSRKNKFILSLAVAVVAVFMVMIVPILTWLSSYFPVIAGRMLATVVDEDDSGRSEIFEETIQMILDNPIFGFSYRVTDTPYGWGPHNGILEVFVALGIPFGLLFIYFIYIRGTALALKNMANQKLLFPTVMMLFSIFASISGSSMVNNAFLFSIPFLCAASYNRLYEKRNPRINII